LTERDRPVPDTTTWRLGDASVPPPAALPGEPGNPSQPLPESRSSAEVARQVSWGWLQVFVGTVVAVLVFFGLVVGIFLGLEAAGVELDENSPGGLALNGVLYASFLGVPIYVAKRRGLPWRAQLGFRPIRWRDWWWLPVGLVLTYIALVALLLIMQAFGVEPEGNLDDALFDERSTVVVAFVMVGALAPIAEEIFFRGFIFAGLARSWGIIPAMLVSGALFGSAHFQWSLLIPFTAVGMVFALLYLKTRSIWAPVAVHAAFNTISLILGVTGVANE
jgi:membrane protease YdiL (CAAX protease family)